MLSTVLFYCIVSGISSQDDLPVHHLNNARACSTNFFNPLALLAATTLSPVSNRILEQDHALSRSTTWSWWRICSRCSFKLVFSKSKSPSQVWRQLTSWFNCDRSWRSWSASSVLISRHTLLVQWLRRGLRHYPKFVPQYTLCCLDLFVIYKHHSLRNCPRWRYAELYRCDLLQFHTIYHKQVFQIIK